MATSFNTSLALAMLLALVACGKSSSTSARQAVVYKYLQAGIVLSPEEVANAEALPDPCEEFRSEIPEDWQQGHLLVPENPAQPQGRKIKVFYYGKVDPRVPPTVFFNGGPSSSSHGSFSRLTREQAKDESREKISFVYIDQRGTGCSDFYPQGTTNEVAQRLRSYGSRGIVSDAEHIRKHLIGNRDWIAFGQSYGAHIVHRYLQVAPAGLVSAHAHGNALNTDGFSRMKIRLASQIRVMGEYLKHYPRDRAVFAVLNRDLHKNRCFTFKEDMDSTDPQDEEKLCGFDAMFPVVELMGFKTSWGRLHEWVQVLVKNDQIVDSEVAEFLSVFATGGESNPLNSSRFAGKVIGWVDRNTVPFDVYNCHRARNELLPGIDLLKSAFHDCSWAMQEAKVETAPVNPVAFLQRDILTPQIFKTVLLANPTIPFYWYSGLLDSFVPVATYEEELAVIKDLPNVHYTRFINSGHDGFYSENKVWQELLKETLR